MYYTTQEMVERNRMLEQQCTTNGGLLAERTHRLLVYENGAKAGRIHAKLARDSTTVHWYFCGHGSERTFEYESGEYELSTDVAEQTQQFVNGLDGDVRVAYDTPDAITTAALHTLTNAEIEYQTSLTEQDTETTRS